MHPAAKTSHPVTLYLFKLAEFCNLNCPYCYMFNLKDFAYQKKPKMMLLDIVETAVPQMVRLAQEQGVTEIGISLHGGEPMLVGKDWIRQAIEIFRAAESQDIRFSFSMQTNGILVDTPWLELLSELDVQVGLSMDGPKEIHDRTRIDFSGRGSYDRVVAGLKLLQEYPELCPGVLCVIDPQTDGLEVYKHFRDLGVDDIDFLWPLDYNWDSPPPHLEEPESTPFADYLISIFDYWWNEETEPVRVRYFDNILVNLSGAHGGLDSLGANPVSIVSIDTDGGIEPLDSLKACGDGFTELGLNVLRDDISQIYETELFQTAIAGAELLSDHCRACILHDVCGAGYLPHRFGREKGFRNPSVYCRDLWKLITHILDASVKTIRKSSQMGAELEQAV